MTVGDARYRGIELAGSARVARGLDLNLSLSKTKNAWTGSITDEARSQLGIEEGKIEPETPQLIIAGVVNYTRKSFYASAAVRHFSDYYILASNDPVALEWDLAANQAVRQASTLPAWTVADLIFGYRFKLQGGHTADVSLHVFNLFDEKYFQIGNQYGLLPGPERNIQVNLVLAR